MEDPKIFIQKAKRSNLTRFKDQVSSSLLEKTLNRRTGKSTTMLVNILMYAQNKSANNIFIVGKSYMAARELKETLEKYMQKINDFFDEEIYLLDNDIHPVLGIKISPMSYVGHIEKTMGVYQENIFVDHSCLES